MKKTMHKSTYPKIGGSAVKSSFVLLFKFVLVDSFVLRNLQLRKSVNHYGYF